MTKCGALRTGHVARRSAENVLHSIRFARDLNQPFNRFVTIDFSSLGIEEEAAGPLFIKLRQCVSRWWRYERKKNPALPELFHNYCHANPAGRRHVHWLLSVPDDMTAAFDKTVEDRLLKLTQLDALGDALHMQKATAPGNAGKYMMKGIDPMFAGYLHIQHVDEGVVTGRRTGVSRNIGRTARSRAGWQRRRRLAA